MDAHTGANLFKEYLLGLLGSKTVIYVTHQVEFLLVADLILVIKDAIFCSEQEPMLSSASELLDRVGFQENEIVTKAFILLQKVILENIGWSLSLIVGDKDINMISQTQSLVLEVTMIFSCKASTNYVQLVKSSMFLSRPLSPAAIKCLKASLFFFPFDGYSGAFSEKFVGGLSSKL